jgi:putative transposase
MAKPPRTAIAGTFFVTAITANRRRLFQTETNAKLLLETLQHYRTQGLYKLHAYVAMPDHIHLLLTTDDLPKSMKHIRGGFSHRLSSNLDVWQRGYADHLVQTREEFESRRLYIHQNPVRARLALQPAEYPYSSASRIPKCSP